MSLLPTTSGEPARSRRTLLAAAAGGLIAAVAGAFGRPAPAGATHLAGFGHTNAAGSANTTLTTSSTGTALLVTQNGTGTALRGSAVGPGSIAGFFTANNGTGISGVTGTSSRYGVYGANDAASYAGGAAVRADGQQNHGLVATTANSGAAAVRAIHGGAGTGVYGASQGGHGVFGYTNGAAAAGVVGVNSATSGTVYGVYGNAPSNGYAGYFAGRARVTDNLSVAGTLTKGAGAFKIDHPLDPAGRYLSHSFVESPDMLNVYNGNTTTDDDGNAVGELPAWFEALNRDFRYQLTVIGQPALAFVASEIADGRFTIATDRPNVKVSWLVTGIRKDPYAEAHRIPVDERKPTDERGTYLHPTEHGQPASKGLDARRATPIPVRG